MKKNSRNFLNSRFCLFTMTLLASAMQMASAQTKPDDTQVEEEVLVIGIRAALEKAADIKRESVQVMDVVTSEDVGKLPDPNVAEALQRITGVQITRVFGEGQSVAIRGLQQVRVEVDGRTLLGFSARVSPPENDNLGRSSGLDSVPSSAFGRLEVLKSPLAKQTEGGLGGVVNMITPKPFDFKKTTVSIRAQGTYSDEAAKTEPNIGGLFTTTFADGDIGILLSGEYQERTSKLQLFERNNWFERLNGAPAGSAPVYAPTLLQYENVDIDRTRQGINGAVQYRLSENLVLTADALYSKVENDRTNQAITFNFPTSNTAAIITNAVNEDRYLVAGTARGNVRVQNQRRADPTDNTLFGLNAKFDDDKLTIDTDAYYSRGTLRQKIEVVVLDTAANSVNANYDFRNGPVPDIELTNATGPNSGQPFFPTLATSYVYPTTGTLTLRANELPATLYEWTGKADVSYKLNEDIKISAGLRHVYLSAESDAFRSRGLATSAQLAPFSTVSSSEFLSSIPGNFPRSFYSVYPVEGFLLPIVLATEPSLEPGAPAGTLRRNPERDYDLSERTLSGYLMYDQKLELLGRPASLNLGLRVSDTDFQVDTIARQGAATTLAAKRDVNDYTNVLPSANFTLNVTDDFLVRLGASQTMQRAGLAELAPSTFVDSTNKTSTGGNAQLTPPISTNFDISTEYYYSKTSLVSGAVFYKKVKDFIASSTTQEIIPGFESQGLFRITRPANVASAEVKGLELGVQQFFDFFPEPFDGIGVIANYTFSDSEDSNGFPLVATSEHSYNLIALYEKGPLSARIAYNWRDDAVFEFTQNRPDVIAARSQLDAQLGFDINDNIALSFQAQNLNPEDSATVEISNFNENAVNSYALSERRFSLGLRAKF